MDKEKTTRQRLAAWSKTPEGRESYEKVASEMRKQIAEDEGMEKEISKSIENLEGCTTKINDNPEYHLISDEDIRKFARHFAQWGANHTPLPEDTALFNKGVEEGKRLMMDEWLKDRDGCFWDGVEEGKKAMEDAILAIIESRLSEIIGDAQPKPALRAELGDIIKRIKDED